MYLSFRFTLVSAAISLFFLPVGGKVQVKSCDPWTIQGYIFKYRERELGSGSIDFYIVTMQTLTSTINVVLKRVTGKYKLSHQSLATTQLYLTGKEMETQTEEVPCQRWYQDLAPGVMGAKPVFFTMRTLWFQDSVTTQLNPKPAAGFWIHV